MSSRCITGSDRVTPERVAPCPHCTQVLTVEEGPRQYGCPFCRAVFETATDRYLYALPGDPNAPPCAQLPWSTVDSSYYGCSSSVPSERGKHGAEEPELAPAATQPRQAWGQATGGAACSFQEILTEVVQIKKEKLDAALKRQAEDAATIRNIRSKGRGQQPAPLQSLNSQEPFAPLSPFVHTVDSAYDFSLVRHSLGGST